jgi:hypothetical protein
MTDVSMAVKVHPVALLSSPDTVTDTLAFEELVMVNPPIEFVDPERVT